MRIRKIDLILGLMIAAAIYASSMARAETVQVGGILDTGSRPPDYVDSTFKIRDDDGAQVADGSTQRVGDGPTGEGADLRPSRAKIELPPGPYTVELSYTSPEGMNYEGRHKFEVRSGVDHVLTVRMALRAAYPDQAELSSR